MKHNIATSPEWLTAAQVGARIGVHEDTVRRYIVAGSLPAEYVLKKTGGKRRTYRIHISHVKKILAGQWPARQG